MITRNVTFNEHVFYDPIAESNDTLPDRELNEIVQELQYDPDTESQEEIDLHISPQIIIPRPVQSAPEGSSSSTSGVAIPTDSTDNPNDARENPGLLTPRLTPTAICQLVSSPRNGCPACEWRVCVRRLELSSMVEGWGVRC
ncbi:hypothetical protein E4U31_006256 [Claviceps sp. LM219 group G6]|nr:hypothetical protein E4U31_006256 [Claviceps sp. LM219 group G6]